MCGKADDSNRAGEENSNLLGNGWTYRSRGPEFLTLRQIFTHKESFILPFLIVFWIGKVSFVLYQNLHKLFYVLYYFTRPVDTKKPSGVDEFHGLCLFI